MAKNIVTEIRKNTRRKFSAEDKIHIVVEGLRGEIPISELARRKGISPSQYYKWSKCRKCPELLSRFRRPAMALASHRSRRRQDGLASLHEQI